ncbi:MAG TPA: Ig-like domain-containing protein [Verrucomicrobiae bacterium]
MANRSTGAAQLNDSVVGASTVYVGFFDPWTGVYAVKSSSGGFQIGSFVVLDTTRPTISISSPATATTYTNARTVTITATASDNVGVTSVEFYDGGILKGTDLTAPYTYDWPFTAADNGAHAWTARAFDAAGNLSDSSPVTLTVNIDTTPPTVAISSPANGAILTTSPTTASGTASDPGSPASGLAGVEVRINGGGWSNATGTTGWTRSVTLSPCLNSVEARSRDRAGNYSSVVSNFFTYTPPNMAPNPPSNASPPNGAVGVSVTPTLEASAFSDPDPACIGDTHAASQWQVLSANGSIVVDSGTDTVNKVTWIVPANKLNYGSNYQWRVRYRDSRNSWSSFSAQTWFTNCGPWLVGLREGTNMVIKWPTNALAFALQWSTKLGTAMWSNAIPAPVIVNGQYTVTNTMTNQARFYRLKK